MSFALLLPLPPLPASQPSRPSNQPTTQLGRQSASHPGIQLRFNPIIPFVVVPFVVVVLFFFYYRDSVLFCVVMVYFRYDVNIIRPTTTTHSHSPQTPPVQSSIQAKDLLYDPHWWASVFPNREIKCMRFRLYFKYCFVVLFFFFFLCSNSVSNELNFKYDQWNFNILSRNLLWECQRHATFFLGGKGRCYGPSLSFRFVSGELNSITGNS